MIELTLAVVVKCFCCSVRKLKMASLKDMMCSSDSEKRLGTMTLLECFAQLCSQSKTLNRTQKSLS